MNLSRSCRTALVAACVATLVLSIAGPSARAAKPDEITAGEMTLLPSFCEHTMGFQYSGPGSGRMSPQADHWVARMGPSFWDIHHYCWALIKMRRGLRPGTLPAMRVNIVKDVVAEYDYVLGRANGEFPMRAEVLLRRGEALMAIDDFTDALASLEAAVRAKPSFWPASMRLAEFHVKYGKRAEALEALNQGLEHSPGQPALLAMQKKLQASPKPNARKN